MTGDEISDSYFLNLSYESKINKKPHSWTYIFKLPRLMILEMPLNRIAMEVLVNDTYETIHFYKKFPHISFLCLLSERHQSGISCLYFAELNHRIRADVYSNQ